MPRPTTPFLAMMPPMAQGAPAPGLTMIPPGQGQPLPRLDAFAPFQRPLVGPPSYLAPPQGQPPAPAATEEQETPDAPPSVPTPPTTPRGAPIGDDYLQLLRQLKDRGDGLAGEQRARGDQYREQMKPLLKPDLQYDLTPLAALVDSWTGSHLQGGYKAPETGDERQAKLMKLREAAGNAGLQASGTELDALKGLAQGTFNVDKLKADQDYRAQTLANQRAQIDVARGKAAKAGSIDPYKAFQMRTAISKLEPAAQARGVTSFVAALNEYENAVNNFDGNPASASGATVRSAYTKMSTRFKEAEKLGALSGPDLDLLRQNVANAGTWENYALGGTKGGIEGIRSAIAQTRRGAANDFNLAMQNLQGVAGEAKPVLDPVLEDYRSAYAKASGGAPEATPEITPDQAAAELARRRGAK